MLHSIARCFTNTAHTKQNTTKRQLQQHRPHKTKHHKKAAPTTPPTQNKTLKTHAL
ncbi:hypothetical protein [Helicobacter phage Pt22899G]|nr:hypothetical protein [Helicobacter phage Pt22899G]